MAETAAEVELDVLLLGPVEARLGGRTLPLGRGKLPALLALLALEPNRVVSSDRLLDALWGSDPPPSAAVALYGLVSQLRKLIEPADAAIVTRAPGYVLELPPERTDVSRFHALVETARAELAAGDPTKAANRLNTALALWRGLPLQDLAAFAFAPIEAAHLAEARLAAVEARIDADLTRGLAAHLVPELEVLVAAEPLRERFRAQLMLALYRSGRQADALTAYRDARAALDELGLEPSQELQTLERAVLRHDPSLEPASRQERAAAAEVNGGSPRRQPLYARPRMLIFAAVGLGAIAAAVAAAVIGGETRGTVRIAANGVGVVEHGQLVAAGVLESTPSDVAAGAGSLWITSTDDQTLSRVEPNTGDVRETIRVGSGASGVAADERSVWVANALGGTVSRIDPRTNTVVQTVHVGGAPVAVALGGGIVWVSSSADQTLSLVDARTGARIGHIPLGASPGALAFGKGSLWVADEKRNVVFRIDPATRAVIDTVAVGTDPAAIAVDAGSVWVANNLDGTVTRLDANTDAVAATIPVGDGPRGIAIGPEGIWVSNEFGGTLALVDPQTNLVARVVRTGGAPQGLAVRESRIFVAVRSSSPAHRGGTLRIVGTSSDFTQSLDTLNGGVAETTILTNDGLVGFRRVGGADGAQVVPDLAVSLPAPTDGGRTYTFRLRDGIRYSNGRLVRPSDFRRALQRVFEVVRDPIFYGAIVGARRCVASPPHCRLRDGIVTDDRGRTVTFHLQQPDPDFLYKLALPYAFAVPADTPAKDVGRHPLPATGPYMVASYRRGVLTLVRNPRFREWSRAAQPAGYPDRIVVRPVASAARGVREVEEARADVAADGVPPELEQEVATQYAAQTHVNPRLGTTYMFLNTQVPPFTDVRVRRAINYAADRGAGARASSRGVGAQPTCQILPPNFPGYERYCPYTHAPNESGAWTAPDLAEARQLVARSGTAGMAVTVWVPHNHRGEATFAVSLMRSLGYKTHAKLLADNGYYGASGPLNPRLRAQAGLFSWFADYPAPSDYIDFFFSCHSAANWSRFCSRGIDAQIGRALTLQSTDPYAANRLWARIDRAIVDLAPVVPLYTLKEIDLVSRRVGNFQYSPPWGVLFDQLWVR